MIIKTKTSKLPKAAMEERLRCSRCDTRCAPHHTKVRLGFGTV